MSNQSQQPSHQNLNSSSSSRSGTALPRAIDASDFDDDYPHHPQQHQHSLQQHGYQEIHASTSAQETDTPQEAPPSYEAIVTKDISQIHDNYDHLLGPPGQRGQDIKIRIPSESLSSSAYRQSAGSSSSNGAGPSVPRLPPSNDAGYGATCSGQGGRSGILHSPTSAQAPELGLRGQIALSPEDEEAERAQDVDPLLSADNESTITSTDLHSEDSDDHDTSSWAIAGDGQVWWSLFYLLVLLLPWTLFCFAWTFCMAMVSTLLMIIPPVGYLFTVLAITSWRALARVDLVLSRSMVSNEIQQRHPFIAAKIFIRPERERGPTWRIFGREISLPAGGFCNSARRRRGRRVRNVWDQSAKHLRSLLDRHTIRGMFYFTVWKMMFAFPVFLVIWILFTLTIPFMVCFLPSLLIVSRAFANWQYRWAVNWLSEKAPPIVIP
ncbi:hypothetical protein BGX31_006224 [Mortierella sp. GBA43]|nr:hypothetical protein BGX31_006224 [Mortierella sp. GBA43]